MSALMLARTASLLPRGAVHVAQRPPHSSRHFTSSPAPHPEPFDVVIVGGGPAGLSLAAALGSQTTSGDSLKVALVESSDLSRVKGWSLDSNTFSNRVSSITNASRQFLDDVGAWEYVDESRTAPIEHMEVWDGLSDARIIFSHSDADSSSSEMATLTENLNLQRALLQRLGKMADQVSVMDKLKVEDISREDSNSWPIVHLSNGSSLRARLLVGADGFNSPVRKFAGIESYGWAYPTHAVVATLQHQPIPTSQFSDPNLSAFPRRNTIAYQRFLPTGPIAFLPLSPSGDISSLVWSTSPQLAAVLKAVRPDVLAMLINAAFRLPDVSMRYLNARLLELAEDMDVKALTVEEIAEEIRFREESDGITVSSPLYSSDSESVALGVPPVGSESYPPLIQSVQVGTQASFPLRLSHADDYVSDRIALVGDAAHTVHPLAGQGLNMGLSDAKALAETIISSMSLGGDIGGYVNLLPYHQARYAPNHGILSVTDKLHKLYALESAPAVWARSVGLEVLNELGPVKGALMSAAGSSSSSWNSNSEDDGYEQREAPSAVWNVTASGIEGFNNAVQLGKVFVGGVRTVIGSVAENVARSVEENNRLR